VTLSRRRTVGVEEELLLVDAHGGASPIGDQVVAAVAEVEHEFKLEQAEIASTPCLEADELRAQLRQRRDDIAAAAQARGGHAVAIATSPLPARLHSTPDGRYARMSHDFGLVAAQQLTCGQHVHVSVESRAEAVAVLDQIRVWLPLLRAISANSPFSQGQDTGYASYRTIMWGQWPTSGPTELFGSESVYDAAVAQLIGSGAALDEGMIYFDARLSAHYPTVEIRVADVCTDVDDAVFIATLCRAMVDTAAERWRAGVAPRPTSVAMLRAATWRASRWGLSGQLVDAESARLGSSWQLLDELLEELGAALKANGDDELVASGRDRLRERGTGADMQRSCWNRTSDLRAVVRDAAERTIAR
jgi:glutamate---cysteine ligase / carboxylate-amine ligase